MENLKSGKQTPNFCVGRNISVTKNIHCSLPIEMLSFKIFLLIGNLLFSFQELIPIFDAPFEKVHAHYYLKHLYTHMCAHTHT